MGEAIQKWERDQLEADKLRERYQQIVNYESPQNRKQLMFQEAVKTRSKYEYVTEVPGNSVYWLHMFTHEAGYGTYDEFERDWYHYCKYKKNNNKKEKDMGLKNEIYRKIDAVLDVFRIDGPTSDEEQYSEPALYETPVRQRRPTQSQTDRVIKVDNSTSISLYRVTALFEQCLNDQDTPEDVYISIFGNLGILDQYTRYRAVHNHNHNVARSRGRRQNRYDFDFGNPNWYD